MIFLYHDSKLAHNTSHQSDSTIAIKPITSRINLFFEFYGKNFRLVRLLLIRWRKPNDKSELENEVTEL